MEFCIDAIACYRSGPSKWRSAKLLSSSIPHIQSSNLRSSSRNGIVVPECGWESGIPNRAGPKARFASGMKRELIRVKR
jgi:hypothetical protein